MVVVAIALVVVAAVVAMPTLLVRFTPVPAERVQGNWNMIHRVEPLSGWKVGQRSVAPDYELTDVTVPSTGADVGYGCGVTVHAAGGGDPTAGRLDRTPVTVQARPGAWAGNTYTANDLPGEPRMLAWEYRPGAFAEVRCPGKHRLQHLVVAERVRFEPAQVTLPFRLRSVPSGYEVTGVQVPLASPEKPPFGGVVLEATDDDTEPRTIGLVFERGWSDPPPERGWETATIRGRPALLDAEGGGLLCLKVEQTAACLLAAHGGPDQSGLGWIPGHREALVEVAERLVFVENLDDPDGWFPANQAIPA